jgi:hypothetical protein
MPPRYAYWTIILDNAPTAFRARDREDLLPTFRQLSGRNPTATIKWFANGRLWESPEEASAATQAKREPRGADWRPGGRHEDPRARFQNHQPKAGRGGTGPGHRPAPVGAGGEQHTGRSDASKPDQTSASSPRQDGARSDKRPSDRRPWSGPARGGAGSDKRPGDRRPWSGPPRTGAPSGPASGARGQKPGGSSRSTPVRFSRPEAGGRPTQAGARERQPWKDRQPWQDRKRQQFGAKAGQKPDASRTPGESRPPSATPPRPPSPDRPPKPGQEPRPDVPREESTRILPKPPERGK